MIEDKRLRTCVVTVQSPLRHTGLLDALSPMMTVGGVVRPSRPTLQRAAVALRSFHPERSVWRARDGFNASTFAAFSRSAATQLAAQRIDTDFLILIYPVLFETPPHLPTIVYTDTTVAITEREYPEWLGLTTRGWREATARERRVFRAAAFVVTEGEPARRSAIEDYGCDEARVVTVGPGLALEAPALLPRRDEGLGDDVLFVGNRFEQRKGGETMLAAWKLVEQSVPSARLKVITRSRPPRALPASVDWIGRVDHTTLVEFLNTSRVYVHPAPYETCVPNTIREALAYGLPVVASDIPAVAEDVPPEVRLFPIGSAEGLARHIVELLGDRALARREGAALFDYARANYRWDEIAARVAELAHDAVRTASATAPDNAAIRSPALGASATSRRT